MRACGRGFKSRRLHQIKKPQVERPGVFLFGEVGGRRTRAGFTKLPGAILDAVRSDGGAKLRGPWMGRVNSRRYSQLERILVKTQAFFCGVGGGGGTFESIARVHKNVGNIFGRPLGRREAVERQGWSE